MASTRNGITTTKRVPVHASANGTSEHDAQASGTPPQRKSTAPSAPAWDYSPAPESFKVTIAPRHGHYINARFVAGSKTFPTINPATEEPLSEIALGTPADVDAAVSAARRALDPWSRLPGLERGKYLFRIARRLQERAREFAVLETLDNGKPIRESRDVDIPLAAQHFFYYAGWADKLAFLPGGPTVPVGSSSGSRSAPLPIGVCAQIIPWNFPLLMAAWKIAPALACGCTVILKPAETTPLTALRLAEVFDAIGLPPGVVNIITGDGSTGAALVDHPGVDKIAFTGSTEVGKRIASSIAAQTRSGRPAKKLTLELGGKSPHIIFDDASIDQAIEGIVQGIFFNQGHVCCAGSRLLVQEGIADTVARKLAHRLRSLRIGDPLDKNTDIGAINSRDQLTKIESYLHAGVDEGATLLCPSLPTQHSAPSTRHSPTSGFPRGFFCRPCFFTGVQPAHAIAREEIFGPVLSILTFRTPDEAIQRANNTPYGLAAGVWTDKGSKIFEMSRRLKAGVIWLNTYNRFDPASPFGGYKESGFGREGGPHGLLPYLA